MQSNTPPAPLYSTGSIGLATLFGGPLATGWLMATNYWRLGERRKSVAAMAVAIVLLIGMYIVPTYVEEWELVVGLTLFALIGIQRALQGAAFRAHIARWGREASAWRALGIGIVSLVVSLAHPMYRLEQQVLILMTADHRR